MTRGVSGILDREDMVREKGGSVEQQMAPTTIRRRLLKPGGQKVLGIVEWRYLSRRDERSVVMGSDGEEMVKVFGVS
jgi:hypothetical protein